MKIWSIVYERPEASSTGFGRVTWCLSKAFIKYGAKVNVIYSIPTRSMAIVKENIDGMLLYGVPTRGRLITKRISFYEQTFQLIKNHFNKNDVNVFLLHGAFSLPLSRPLRELHSVIIYHTFGTLLGELRSSLPELVYTFDVGKILRYISDIPIETFYMSYLDAIIVPHERSSKEFEDIYRVKGDRIYISPYGQDIYDNFHDEQLYEEVRRFRVRFKGKKLILFVGGSAWNRKGARWTLHSFRKLLEHIPAILIMTGIPTKQYLLLASQLGLQIGEDIITPGLVDNRTLASLYAACDVFFLPSLHEGFSQPVIEVMAYGKPVIVSPIAAYPTIEDGNEGYIINFNDINSYTNALLKILTDQNLYATMSKKARLKAQRYEWDMIGLNLIKNLKQIVINRT